MAVVDIGPCTLETAVGLIPDLNLKRATHLPSPQSEKPQFPPPEVPRPARPWTVWLATIASLWATAWVVWFATLVPRLSHLPLRALITEAVEYSLLAWAWSAAIALGFYLLIPKPPGFDSVQATLRTSATAVWLAPAMLSISASSLGALAAGLLLVASTTRLLYSQWRLFHQPVAHDLPYLSPGLSISLNLQIGLLLVLMGDSLAAAAFLGTAMVLATVFTSLAGAWPERFEPSLPRSVVGVLLTVLFSAAVTVVGLSPRLIVNPEDRWDNYSQGRPGFFRSTRQLFDGILYGKQPPKQPDPLASQPEPPPMAPAGDVTDTAFPGVIIWPEIQPQTLLIPPLPAMGHGLLNLPAQAPLSIPFAGQYWLYKPPSARPPEKSLTRRGTPLDLGFRTTDHRAMIMEAYHRFDEPISLRCCSSIRLAISNLDPYFGTVRLELILIHTPAKGRSFLSLGKAPVLSAPLHTAPPWRGGRTLPAPETLESPIPAGTALREFDEIKIVFHRDRMRLDHSAKIAIERIIFVP
jgi:hypothetical protein